MSNTKARNSIILVKKSKSKKKPRTKQDEGNRETGTLLMGMELGNIMPSYKE